MKQQDFIFSVERKNQLIRHISFWVVWWFSFFLFFHLPQHAIFGWNLNEANQNLVENGFWWILKMLIFNVLLAVILPQMIFTYTLLYYILPQYFYKKRRAVTVITVLFLFFIAYLIISACFKPLSQLPNYFMGLHEKLVPPQKITFFAALRDTLTSLPLVVGIALTIKLMKRWSLKEQEIQQIANEKVKSELQLLKAQIHPHFLFNTLNNIYYFTLSGSKKAPEMIKKLSDLLHYILQDCKHSRVPLEKEIKMIQDYVSLEKIRYENRINFDFNFPDLNNYKENSNWYIAPLLLIPFVENSFKHGASKMLTEPYIKMSLFVENESLLFFIENSCPPSENESSSNKETCDSPGKFGLKNVKKRLALLYPDNHEISIIKNTERFKVTLRLQLERNFKTIENFNNTSYSIYELA